MNLPKEIIYNNKTTKQNRMCNTFRRVRRNSAFDIQIMSVMKTVHHKTWAMLERPMTSILDVNEWTFTLTHKHIHQQQQNSLRYLQFFYPNWQIGRHFGQATLGAIDNGPQTVAVDRAGGRGWRKEQGEHDQRRRQPKQACVRRHLPQGQHKPSLNHVTLHIIRSNKENSTVVFLITQRVMSF